MTLFEVHLPFYPPLLFQRVWRHWYGSQAVACVNTSCGHYEHRLTLLFSPDRCLDSYAAQRRIFNSCGCLMLNFISCTPAMLRPGIVFGSVCLSVCLSVHTKSRKLPFRNWCNLVTFEVDPRAILVLDLETSFLVRRYVLRMSVSRSRFKVIGPMSRSRQQYVEVSSLSTHENWTAC